MKRYTMGYLRKDGKTLMIHRDKVEVDGSNDRKWNGIGGKFDADEMPEECFKREVKEETGLTIKNIRPLGTIWLPGFAKGEDVLIHVFESDKFKGVCKKKNHEGELHWVEDNKLVDLDLWPVDKVFMPEVVKGNSFSIKLSYNKGKSVPKLIAYKGKPEYSKI